MKQTNQKNIGIKLIQCWIIDYIMWFVAKWCCALHYFDGLVQERRNSIANTLEFKSFLR